MRLYYIKLYDKQATRRPLFTGAAYTESPDGAKQKYRAEWDRIGQGELFDSLQAKVTAARGGRNGRK